MTADDEDRAPAEELPSFADLVDRLEGTGDADRALSEAADPEEPAELADLAGRAAGDERGAGDAGDDELGADPAERGRPLSGSKAEALIELIEDAANVLVLGPRETAVEYELCTTLCRTEAYPRRRLLVTTGQSADDRLTALRGYGAEGFDETTVIAVGDRMRSPGGDGSVTDVGGETIRIESISNPRDLTRLGLLINKHLGRTGEDAPPELCFHTLSTLLDAAPVEQVFRFFHVLQGRVRAGGGRAHYHLDPDEHPPEVVNTLRPLVDFTVRFDAGGDVSVDR